MVPVMPMLGVLVASRVALAPWTGAGANQRKTGAQEAPGRMMTMYEYHKCEGIPEGVEVGALYAGKKAIVVTNASSATHHRFRIYITHCPFCGKRLDEGQTESDEITLRVRPFDAHDGLGAYKVLEEAAEVQVAYKGLATALSDHGHAMEVDYINLADEIADVIQAAVNLAHVNGLDVSEAMERCTESLQVRGRYDG